MKFLNLLKKYVIDSQLFVSLTGSLLAAFIMLEQNTFRYPSFLLIFITYFSGYLYTKYQGHQYFGRILVFNGICGVICALLIFFNHHEIRLVKWLVIVVLGLLYNSFFLDKYIRKIPLLKVFYVGFVWALVNSWLVMPSFHVFIFLSSFFFTTALVLPFDIRDMHTDNVVTFPRLIGIQNTKYLAYLLVFVAFIIINFNLKTSFAVAFFLAAVVSFILIYFSKNSNRDSYFSFWVESCAALPFLFLIILKYF